MHKEGPWGRGGPRPLAPDSSLFDVYWAVGRRLRHSNAGAAEPHGLSPSHTRALVTLLRHDGQRLSWLAERLHIAPRSVTEVVDALEERGLVVRQPDPSDRRATLVAVTDAGRELGAELLRSRAAEADTFFARLDESDKAELRRILLVLLEEDPQG